MKGGRSSTSSVETLVCFEMEGVWWVGNRAGRVLCGYFDGGWKRKNWIVMAGEREEEMIGKEVRKEWVVVEEGLGVRGDGDLVIKKAKG